MPETIAGIPIPDSTLATAATELVRDVTSDLIYHHSRRVYVWGALRGIETGVSADPELLYVGAMFHDLGLTQQFRTDGQRFEIDGADEARRFLLSHDVPAPHADDVWNAIALHTTPEVPLHMSPVVALVTRGVELDVLGIGYDSISDEQREHVVRAHPPSGLQEPDPPRLPRRSPSPPGDHVRQREGRCAPALRARVRTRRLRRGRPDVGLGRVTGRTR